MKAQLTLTSIFALALAACSAPEESATEVATSDAPETEMETTPAEDAAAEEQEESQDDGGLPQVDIHVSTLVWRDGMPMIADRIVATPSGRYDNQPSFDSEDSFYFTAGSADGQTDVRHYSLQNGESRPLTETVDEGEFSPRLTPDGQAITYIHQAPGDVGGQVYRQELDGSGLGPLHGYGPSGYYALNADMTQMVMFALTEPFTLVHVDLNTGVESTVWENVGRALYTAPDGQSAYFTTPREEQGWQVMNFDFATGTIAAVFDLPGLSEDYAVFTTPEGEEGWLSASEGTLFFRLGATEWQSVSDLAAMDVTGVTRLAVSPQATRLAIVAEE